MEAEIVHHHFVSRFPGQTVIIDGTNETYSKLGKALAKLWGPKAMAWRRKTMPFNFDG